MQCALADTKHCVPIVTLSTQDNENLLQQLKSGFKILVNWNKNQSKITMQTQNPYLDFLIDPSFQLFLLLLEIMTIDKHPQYFLPKIEIKD